MKGLLAVPIIAWLATVIRHMALQLPPKLEAEPDGLAASLRNLPRRVLTAEERQEFHRTGVVHVPGVLSDPELVDFLAWRISQVASLDDEEALHKAWFFNGPIRALAREELLADLAVSALGAPLGEGGRWAALEEAPLWASTGSLFGGRDVDLYHADDRFHIERPYPLVSVWFALTDSVAPIEFVRGSHEVLRQMFFTCGKNWEGGVANFAVYPIACAQGFRALLENITGTEPFYRVDVRKGDAFVFHGFTLHRRIEQAMPRLAITMRYQVFDGKRTITPSTFYVFPREPQEPDSLPWLAVPRLGLLSPLLPPESRGRLTWGRWR